MCAPTRRRYGAGTVGVRGRLERGHGVGRRSPRDPPRPASAPAPARACSAARARTGTLPIPISATAARGRSGRRPPAPRTRRPRWRSRRAAGRARPRRTRLPGPQTGRCTAVTSSSGSSVVVNEDTKKSAAGMRRRAPDAAHLDLGVQRHGHRGQFRGRVGVGERPAQRAAVADLEVPDVRRRPGQQRHRGADGLVPLQRPVPGQRAHPQRAVRPGDAARARRCG